MTMYLKTLAHPERFFSTFDFRSCLFKDEEKANLVLIRYIIHIYLKKKLHISVVVK